MLVGVRLALDVFDGRLGWLGWAGFGAAFSTRFQGVSTGWLAIGRGLPAQWVGDLMKTEQGILGIQHIIPMHILSSGSGVKILDFSESDYHQMGWSQKNLTKLPK